MASVEINLDVSLEKAIKTVETLMAEPLFGTQKERLLEVLLTLQMLQEGVEALTKVRYDPAPAGGGADAGAAVRDNSLAAVPVGDGSLELVEEREVCHCGDWVDEHTGYSHNHAPVAMVER